MKSVLTDDIFHLLQAVGDFQIGLVMRPAAPLDAARLDRALSGLVAALPVLRCAYVPGWRRGRWEKTNHAGRQILSVMPADDIDRQIEAFFTDPVAPYIGLQMKCLLLEGKHNTLCLNLSHFIADAVGVRELAYSLCRAYNDPDSIKPAEHDRGLGILFKTFSCRQKLGILGRTVRDMIAQSPFPPSASLPAAGTGPFERQYVIRHMGSEITHHLKGLAAGYQATSNDVLMAAFLRALMPLTPSGRRPAWRLVVTADLRRHLPPHQRSGQVRNLSGWVFTSLGRDPGRNLEDTCRRVAARMNRLKDGYLGLGMIPLCWLAVRGLPPAVTRAGMKTLSPVMLRRVAVAPSFTNMGRIDHRALVFDDQPVDNAFLLAPIVYAPILGVGISAFEDTMTLSAGFNVPGFAPTDIIALLDGIISEIRTA